MNITLNELSLSRVIEENILNGFVLTRPHMLAISFCAY